MFSADDSNDLMWFAIIFSASSLLVFSVLYNAPCITISSALHCFASSIVFCSALSDSDPISPLSVRLNGCSVLLTMTVDGLCIEDWY